MWPLRGQVTKFLRIYTNIHIKNEKEVNNPQHQKKATLNKRVVEMSYDRPQMKEMRFKPIQKFMHDFLTLAIIDNNMRTCKKRIKGPYCFFIEYRHDFGFENSKFGCGKGGEGERGMVLLCKRKGLNPKFMRHD